MLLWLPQCISMQADVTASAAAYAIFPLLKSEDMAQLMVDSQLLVTQVVCHPAVKLL